MHTDLNKPIQEVVMKRFQHLGKVALVAGLGIVGFSYAQATPKPVKHSSLVHAKAAMAAAPANLNKTTTPKKTR